jgi:hypothetical protein
MPKSGSKPSVVDGKKFCKFCDDWRPIDEFKVMQRNNRPNVTYFPVCIGHEYRYFQEQYEARKDRHPEFWRPVALRTTLKKYGLTEDDWDRMVTEQEGKCAICGRVPGATLGVDKNRLVIDHDHATGKVRALLCDFCNRGIGMFYDDPDLLVAAAEYVRRYEGSGG